MNADAMNSTIQPPDANPQDLEHTRPDEVDPCDYAEGSDAAGRTWRPSSIDELEAALSLAAIDARLPIGQQWSGFCLAAARRLNVPGAVPLRSGRRSGDDAPRM